MARPVPPTARRKSGFGSKADLAIAIFETGQKAYNQGRDLYNRYIAFSVTVLESDALYSEVHAWLTRTVPHEKQRAMAVYSGSRSSSMEAVSPDDTSRPEPKPLTIRFNDKVDRTVLIEGNRVKVSLRTPDPNTNLMREPEPSKIVFMCRNHDAQQAVVRLLTKLDSDRTTARKANLKMVGQWGGWNTRSDLPPRTMDSVSLPKDQKERIALDLKTFLEQEDKYNKLAIPWHRGYMFHGPPGTGKTSLVKALANEFNMDLWYVSLADLKAESGLLQLLSNVGPRSILLLEDIDTMKITHDRDGSDQGTISMSSLLNTLDGVATPHGLITVMTTNRFDILDEALTRAGRMDLVEKLDYPSMATIIDMFKHFYGDFPESWSEERWDDNHGYHEPIPEISTAQIAEAMKRHMEDFSGAVDAVEDIFNKRRSN